MALCATTALAGAVSRLCVRGARGRFGGVRAGTWCCVSPSSPFPPRVFRAACGGPSCPGVPYPRSLVRHSMRSVRSVFIGACNFYRRHTKNFTYTSAILTGFIKKSTTWRWGPQQQQPFDELKDKVANAKCLGLPRAQGEIILVTDATNVGGGGTLFQWQALEKEEFDSAISQWGTDGLNRDGTLKHSYPDDKWVLVPLGHRNMKWKEARGNYFTYEEELLTGMLVISSQSRLVGSNQWPGCVTKNRSAPSRRDPPLRRLSSDAGGPT